MKLKNIFTATTTGLIFLLLSACSMPKPTPAVTPTPENPPATSIEYRFVTNKLLLPTTQAQVQEFGLNIDQDAQQRPDNLVGQLLSLLNSAAPGLEPQSVVDQAVNAGQLVSLHVVKTADPVNSQAVSWSIFQGKETASAPSFNGTDKFSIDPGAPINPPLLGTLTNGHFSGGPGTARAKVYLMGQPVEVDLIGVRIEADMTVMGCANGKLGGGVTAEEFRSKLLPAVTDGLNQIMKTDKDMAGTVLSMLDADHNGSISAQEVEDNSLLKFATSPDLDLLDASGKFNPGQDGVKDSYSVGLGFTCVPAVFTLPGE